jgi:hypothetical protein
MTLLPQNSFSGLHALIFSSVFPVKQWSVTESEHAEFASHPFEADFNLDEPFIPSFRAGQGSRAAFHFGRTVV